MAIGPGETLAGGVTPAFTVDVTAAGATYRCGEAPSSSGELAAAWHAAATYKPPTAAIITGTIILAVIALVVQPWLLLGVLLGAITALVSSDAHTARMRRVGVLYHLDAPSAQAFESLGNGVGWLGGSRGLWRVTNEERAAHPAYTTSVTRADAHASRGEAPNVITNVTVASVAAGGQTLLFFPDALFVRDGVYGFSAIPYSAIRVDYETSRFFETQFVPPDATQAGYV